MTERKALINRTTKETSIQLQLNLDGHGLYQIDTGIPFLDHMLEIFSRHSLIDLELRAEGDLAVDDHHTVEDIGICLGLAFKEALSDKQHLRRYGSKTVPMDEALISTALDLSGRSYLSYQVVCEREQIKEFQVELVKEFLVALVNNADMTLHVIKISGENSHHILECVFKSLALALQEAVSRDIRIQQLPSTKGVI